MSVTIHPQAVSAIGGAARDVAETIIGLVPKELSSAQGAAGSARIQECASSGSLDACLSAWVGVGNGLRDKTNSTGNKLVTTASIYSTTDHQSGDLFKRFQIPPGVGGH